MSPPFLPNDIAGAARDRGARVADAGAAAARAGARHRRRPSPIAPNPTLAKPPAPPAAGANVAAVDAANPQQKSVASKAIEKVKEVAKSAGDIFSRVPCLPPKGGARKMVSLPRVASKLAAGAPVLIVAFGSSSTQGYGSTSPDFTYPNRLAAQLRRQYPTADITVVNRGKGGEDAPEMMKRLQTEVIDMKPDLVIWQVGTNAVLRNLDPAETIKLVEEGIAQDSGDRRRSGAGRSAIFAGGQRAGAKAPAR